MVISMNISFYGNGSAGNHGCEAIVRGTATLLGNHTYRILSEKPKDDQEYGLTIIGEVVSARQPVRRNFGFLIAYAKMKLTGNFVDMDGLAYLPGIREQKGKADVALSVGGDNYCYEGTGIYPYLNRAYHAQGIKTVLWGCSVEPEVVERPEIAKDMAQYDLVVARESITYNALRAVQPNTVLAPDPAFFMEPECCDLDHRFQKGNVIGINISPKIVSSETVSGMAYENYRQLVWYLLNHTDAYIALIPHVVWESNDDRTVLYKLYEDFGRDERLILVDDHTAPQLKFIISRCSFFVGARTHATIAAYSSTVPTLVIGYSVKARGIARDLFGTEDGYVLPVQSLTAEDQLTKAFCKLYSEKARMRKMIKNRLPEYLAAAQDLREMLRIL